ncbi:MAG: 3-isopropylmalate dehydratase small subunit [Sphingomicrobium sp.]
MVTPLSSICLPLIRDNVDTDAIIPSREMTTTGKTGLADGLFAGWRYVALGTRSPDPSFILNNPAYRDARIILSGANFGCGSSREHAVWALAECGFRAILATSFNPIFQGNCLRNGILPVTLAPDMIAELQARSERAGAPTPVTIVLASQTIIAADGSITRFDIDSEAKEMLLHGLDAIDLTLRSAPAIAAFRHEDYRNRPWAYFSSC